MRARLWEREWGRIRKRDSKRLQPPEPRRLAEVSAEAAVSLGARPITSPPPFLLFFFFFSSLLIRTKGADKRGEDKRASRSDHAPSLLRTSRAPKRHPAPPARVRRAPDSDTLIFTPHSPHDDTSSPPHPHPCPFLVRNTFLINNFILIQKKTNRIGFGGYSGSQNLAAAYDDLGGGASVDSDIGRVMKHLLKQSASTKLKALQELIDTVTGGGSGGGDQQER